jgi:hypothetical protein
MFDVGRAGSKFFFVIICSVLVLGVTFVFTGCGKDPQLKVADSDRGPFALDFSLAPANIGVVTGVNPDFPSIEDEELTIEAWVKSRSDNLNGGIFGRMDAHGIALYIKDDEPKMVIRREPIGGDEMRCDSLTPTSTECIVESNFSLTKNVWTHIAGVLVNEDHTGIHPACSANDGAEAESPHMDIYINGEFQDCATTESRFAANTFTDPSDPTKDNIFLTIGVIGYIPPNDILTLEGISGETRFDGVIDEVRFWRVARTQAQIQACMNQELSISTPGDCYIDPSILLGYWRFNEGQEAQMFDISGNGSSGVIESPGLVPWSTGWVEGAPITRDPGY